MKKVLTLKVPAKVNLYLKVFSKRNDGYHDIASLMQMVGLYDLLTFQSARSGIRLEVSGGGLPTDRSNLVFRAAELLQKEAKVSEGAHISLAKNIPIAAGLGGGSGDAAATLVGLNRIWKLGWSRFRLAELGATLGSDVPFFFNGPTAWVFGRGEKVETSQKIPEGWVVLMNPGRPVSTAWVYQELSKIRLTRKAPNITMNKFNAERPSLKEIFCHPYNDLEKVTFKAFPELIQIKRELHRLGGQGALMSGSGPTLFALFSKRSAAMRAAREIKKMGAEGVWVAKALKRSPL